MFLPCRAHKSWRKWLGRWIMRWLKSMSLCVFSSTWAWSAIADVQLYARLHLRHSRCTVHKQTGLLCMGIWVAQLLHLTIRALH